jgi:hypothetical protein
MKMTLSCSDPKCDGKAEVIIKGKEEREINIKQNCSIKFNEHVYNYKKFFIEKIRKFDIVKEEISYPEIQKIIFGELFVHDFELTEAQAILIFEKKFKVKPILTKIQIEEIKSKFISEISKNLPLKTSNNESKSNENHVNQKKKTISRSKKFWEAFKKLL